MTANQNETEQFINKAGELLDSGDLSGAAEIYLEGFKKTNDWRFANEAGVCFQQISDFKNADNAFQKALPLAPDRFFVLFNIGINYSMMGEFENAQKALIEIWDENLDPKAGFEIGYIDMKEGRFEEAIGWFDKAIFYDYTLNGYNMSGSEGLDAGLAARVFLNKARIFGFETNNEDEAIQMIDNLKDEVDDEDRLFTFAKEAVEKGKPELAKHAASKLVDFYSEYEDVEDFCNSLGVVPK